MLTFSSLLYVSNLLFGFCKCECVCVCIFTHGTLNETDYSFSRVEEAVVKTIPKEKQMQKGKMVA